MSKYKYATINDVAENPDYPFTKGQLRAFLMERHQNGLDRALRKIGKCLYIRIDLFDEWIESHTDEITEKDFEVTNEVK